MKRERERARGVPKVIQYRSKVFRCSVDEVGPVRVRCGVPALSEHPREHGVLVLRERRPRGREDATAHVKGNPVILFP